ncbi:unnamed protein product [Pleuronectes platessa]|uniref:Uncharacterized protein n=1 Tax=Pleuronectes platessa TaxID=8262 RepID=A0A9N7UCR5_PLEPL|nr:unnamed protein product [Pleuronectes platessa]
MDSKSPNFSAAETHALLEGEHPVIEGEGQSQVEPEGLVSTGPPERGSKHPKKDDAYKQTKARLEIRLLKAKLGHAGLSTADEADDDDEEEEGELIRRTKKVVFPFNAS